MSKTVHNFILIGAAGYFAPLFLMRSGTSLTVLGYIY